MENRRQHYRHHFPPTRPIAVRLQSAEGNATLDGDLVDLSIGGMCVYAAKLKEDRSASWTVTLTLESTPPLRLTAERVHKRVEDGTCCGFRFVADKNVEVAEEYERAIWKFLLDEQRRRRRYLRGE